MRLKTVIIVSCIMLTGKVSNAQWALGGNALAGGERLGSTNNFPVNFFTNNIQRMQLQNGTGNFAVGGTPNDRFDVFGGNIDVETNTRAYKLGNREILWYKGANTNLFVGEGAGSNHSFNTQCSNTFIGYQAGFTTPGIVPTNTSIANTHVGYQAGYNNVATGSTYMGYQAGFSHSTTINLNTCVGYQCGYSNQDGDNAFYGALCARNFVWGSGNSVVGQVAGENMNLCSNVTFMGLAAGRNNGAFNRNSYFGAKAGNVSLGEDNVFIGESAGLNGIGYKNTIVGNSAMQAATSGTENVVIGYHANLVSTGTSFNTIIGSQAALANNGGANNTFVGYQTAVAQTSGTNNAYFGLQAGSNMLTGGGNTFLGARADATNPNSSINNAAALGAGALVTNSNHMILGNNFVNVGIGLSADPTGPQNKLEINTAVANTSGLRFRQLTSASLAGVNPGPGVLTVDAVGDVIYVAAPNAGAFGGNCGTTPPAMTNDWEIPLGGFNYVYSGNGAGTAVNNVGIGTNCTPQAKLHVDQSSGSTAGSIGLLVENNDVGPCNNSIPVVAIKGILSTPTNVVSDQYRVGGWFDAGISNNCGVVNNFAIYVPQNGGFVSIGYPTPSIPGGGLVDINGVTNSAGGYTSFSDATLKNSVVTIPDGLKKINDLRAVTFKWNKTNGAAMEGTHAGFIAQEVEKVIPEVVKTQPSGLKSMNYDEIIPYLVSAVQSQQQQIHYMDSVITVLTKSANTPVQPGTKNDNSNSLSQINISLTDKDIIVLNQNVPNPFAEQTTITYNVPEKYNFAQLVFKTMDGKIIKTVDITKKGRGQVNVFANDLTNGLYMYSLIVDGNIIDTKKLVKQN